MLSNDAARKVNFLAIMGIAGVLLGSLVIQFVVGDLPCPLCLLQRLAFVLVCVGPLLNLRFGIRPAHYAVSILAALFGMSVSLRQILLHIVPGTGGYGAAVFGLHLYTWAFLIFFASLVVVGVMLILHPEDPAASPPPEPGDKWTMRAFAAMTVLAAVLAAASFLECGWEECPDNPRDYRELESLPPAPAQPVPAPGAPAPADRT